MEGCFGCSPWNNLKIRSGASVRSAIFLMIITSKYPSETDARGAASANPPTLFEFATKKSMISSVPLNSLLLNVKVIFCASCFGNSLTPSR